MAKMKYWLESSAAPEKRATLQTLRRDQRDEYMRRFLVYQIREKETGKRCVSSKTHSNKRAKCEALHEWGYEKFLAEIGRDRALAWIASDKIKSIPDPFAGSEVPEMRTYFVPRHAGIFEQANKVSRSITAATNACEVDVQDMDVLQDFGPGSSTDVSLKREPQSDEDKFNRRVNEFLAKPVTLLRTLQDQKQCNHGLDLGSFQEQVFVSDLWRPRRFSSEAGKGHRSCRRVIHVSASALTCRSCSRWSTNLTLSSCLSKTRARRLASTNPATDPSAELERFTCGRVSTCER